MEDFKLDLTVLALMAEEFALNVKQLLEDGFTYVEKGDITLFDTLFTALMEDKQLAYTKTFVGEVRHNGYDFYRIELEGWNGCKD